MDEHDVQPAARILNDGHFYFADLQLQKALAAVKAIDPPAAGVLFERWRDDGRIRPDLEADQRHSIAPKQDSVPPTRQQDSERDSLEVRMRDPQFDKEYRLAAAEDLDNQRDAHHRDWRYEMGYEMGVGDTDTGAAPRQGHRR
jgi:hypothetical protein